jgi:hypothetical protein
MNHAPAPMQQERGINIFQNDLTPPQDSRFTAWRKTEK